MKKYMIVLLCLLLVICMGSAVGITYANRRKIDDQILELFSRRLDYEHARAVGGSFQKYFWGEFTYQINYYDNESHLEYFKDDEKYVLLNSVLRYNVESGKFYVVATKGCAVVEGNNVARIYTSEPHVSVEGITYISDFNDFAAEEQEVFKNLM